MKYSVSIEVVYTDIVEADSEEEAIDIVMANCPYDNEPSKTSSSYHHEDFQ